MKTSRTGMTAKRWAYLKALTPPEGRMFFEACAAAMIPHQTNPLAPATPWVAKGVSYVSENNRKDRRAERRMVARRYSLIDSKKYGSLTK